MVLGFKFESCLNSIFHLKPKNFHPYPTCCGPLTI